MEVGLWGVALKFSKKGCYMRNLRECLRWEIFSRGASRKAWGEFLLERERGWKMFKKRDAVDDSESSEAGRLATSKWAHIFPKPEKGRGEKQR